MSRCAVCRDACDATRPTNRIIEIEWAVKNGKEFKPSPKKPRKTKTKKKGKEGKAKGAQAVYEQRAVSGMETVIEVPDEEEGEAGFVVLDFVPEVAKESEDEETVESLLEQREVELGRFKRMMKHRFGSEVTDNPSKRGADDQDGVDMETPMKKQRKNRSQETVVGSDVE